MVKKRIMDKTDIEKKLSDLSREILEEIDDPSNLAVVGIKTRGEYIAKRLVEKIKSTTGVSVSTGAMDITLYRDDFRSKKQWPLIKKTEIDFNIEDMDILLVDDVIFTGRTARAAIGALMDYGRPNSVKLVVLVDRGHRELPIQPDHAGIIIDTRQDEQVNVSLKESDGIEEVTIE